MATAVTSQWICAQCGRPFRHRNRTARCDRCARRRADLVDERAGLAHTQVWTMADALALIEGHLAVVSDPDGDEAALLRLELDALRWCAAHPGGNWNDHS